MNFHETIRQKYFFIILEHDLLFYVIFFHHKTYHIYFCNGFPSLLICDVTMSSLSWPETKLAVLLEQACHVSEELALDLRSTQGSSQVEAVSQKLLENHILIITHIVKKLGQEVKVCTPFFLASLGLGVA